MKVNEKSRSFLTEFIIVILFFSIAAVIVVSVFVKANTRSKDSSELTQITFLAQNIETALNNVNYNYELPLNKEGEVVDTLSTLGFKQEESYYIAYFNDKFDVCSKENAKFIAIMDAAVDETHEYSKIVSFNLEFKKQSNDETVYSISFNKLLLNEEKQNGR